MAIQEQSSGINDFGIEVEYQEGSTCIRLSGELDISTAPQLREWLEHTAEQEAGTVIIDLSELRFMESTGLSLIVMFWKRLLNSGGTLQLRQAQPAVRRVFEITGLTELLGAEVVPNEIVQATELPG